jgi:hypothetical protein
MSTDFAALKKKARELGFSGVPTKQGGVNGLRDTHVVRITDVDDLLAEAVDVAEDELNRNYQLGISAGFDRAAKLLMERSGELFKGRNDEKAKEVRSLADQFFTLSCQEHPDPNHST